MIDLYVERAPALPPEEEAALLKDIDAFIPLVDALSKVDDQMAKLKRRARKAEQRIIDAMLEGAAVEPGPYMPVIVEKTKRSGSKYYRLEVKPNPDWKG